MIALKGGEWYAGIGTRHSAGTRFCRYPVTARGRASTNTLRRQHPPGAGGLQGGHIGRWSAGRPASVWPRTGSTASSASRTSRPPAPSPFSTRRATCSRVARNYVISSSTKTAVFTPCRVGTPLLKNLMDKLHNGCGSPYDFTEIEKLNQLLQSMSHCGLGHTACNPVLDTIAKVPPYYDQRMTQQDFAGLQPRPRPGCGAVNDRARRCRRHLSTEHGGAAQALTFDTLDGKTIPFTEGQTIIRRRARPGLHPAPVLPPGIQAARLVQAMHGQVIMAATPVLHHARLARHGGGKRNRGNQRRTPGADPDAVRRGNHFCPRAKKWRLPAAGHGLSPRHDEPALRPLLPEPAGRCLAPGGAARFQPLHPLFAVRTGQPRCRWQERFRALRPGHQDAPDRQCQSPASWAIPTSRSTTRRRRSARWVSSSKRAVLPCRSASANTTRRRLPTP